MCTLAKTLLFQAREGTGLLALSLGQELEYLNIYKHLRIRSQLIVHQSDRVWSVKQELV